MGATSKSVDVLCTGVVQTGDDIALGEEDNGTHFAGVPAENIATTYSLYFDKKFGGDLVLRILLEGGQHNLISERLVLHLRIHHRSKGSTKGRMPSIPNRLPGVLPCSSHSPLEKSEAVNAKRTGKQAEAQKVAFNRYKTLYRPICH